MSGPTRTGLFLGSFNPVHQGHLILAEFFASLPEIEEVWMVLSPQNPFKKDEKLLDFETRWEWLCTAVADNPRLKACDIERHMPLPSYTYDTLQRLRSDHPDRSWALLLGEDQLAGFHQWKHFRKLLEQSELWVYPRHNALPGTSVMIPHRLVQAPKIEISSTVIRERLHKGLSVRYLLPDGIWKTCANHPFWRG